jgi:hypothetical protein
MSESINPLPSGNGWVRWYSKACCVVAFERAHLTSREIGRHLDADITMYQHGAVDVDITKSTTPQRLKALNALAQEAIDLMSFNTSTEGFN